MSRELPAVRGQLRRIAILLVDFGLSDRDRGLGYCSAVAGRPLTSRKQLTAREASRVLDLLEAHLDGAPHDGRDDLRHSRR